MTMESPRRGEPTPQAEWLAHLAGASNYTRWIVEAVAPHLFGDILEVGCGTGSYTPHLAGLGGAVTAVDIDAAFVAEAQRATKVLPNVTVRLADATTDPLPGQFQSVVLLDVLEHIEQDADFLRRLADRLTPGGRIVLKVPAIPTLHNSMDRAVGHYRRYDRAGLEKVAERAGLGVGHVEHFNALGVLGWWWNGRVGRAVAPSTQIAGFDRVVPVARVLDVATAKRVGLSLIAVLTKA